MVRLTTTIPTRQQQMSTERMIEVDEHFLNQLPSNDQLNTDSTPEFMTFVTDCDQSIDYNCGPVFAYATVHKPAISLYSLLPPLPPSTPFSPSPPPDQRNNYHTSPSSQDESLVEKDPGKIIPTLKTLPPPPINPYVPPCGAP